MQSRKSYFEKCGQLYLSTKGLNFDTWIEAIDEGCKGDVLTLYGLSLLANVHTYIHLHNGQFWSTLKNVPSNHDETLRKCKVHALYLGRGLFVKLREQEVPLQIIDNPNPKVISIIIGKLSELETKMYEDILHTGLGVGKSAKTAKSVELKASNSSSVSIPKQGLRLSLDEPLDKAPLDLSVDDKAIPTMQPGPVIPLDLSFDQSSDDSSLPKNDTPYESPATLDTPPYFSPLPKVLDQPNQQVRAKYSDPKLKCMVTVDLKKLDLKVDQSVKVRASHQKE